MSFCEASLPPFISQLSFSPPPICSSSLCESVSHYHLFLSVFFFFSPFFFVYSQRQGYGTDKTHTTTFLSLPSSKEGIKFGQQELDGGRTANPTICQNSGHTDSTWHSYRLEADETGWRVICVDDSNLIYRYRFDPWYSDDFSFVDTFSFWQDKSVIIGQHLSIDQKTGAQK